MTHTWPKWLPGPYMVKTFKISFFGTKRLMTLKLSIQHRVLKYYQICSNDDTGLTVTILMTWSNLFPNASAFMKAYTTYSHVSYALRWAIQDQWSSGFICEGNSWSIHKIISTSTLVCALLGSTFKVFIYYRKKYCDSRLFCPLLGKCSN